MKRGIGLCAVLGCALLGAPPLSAPAAACSARECAPRVAVLGESPPVGGGVFRFPQAIAYSPGASRIFVADQFSAVVQRFDRTGRWLGDIGYRADDRELGRIGVVGGLATDRAGHLFVLDSENDRVQVFDAGSGRWLAAWGTRGTEPGRFRLGRNTGAGGIAIEHPTPDAPVVVYIADQNNHRIQAFRLAQAASGDPGHPVLPPGRRSPEQRNVVAVPSPATLWGAFGNCAATGCTDPAFQQRLDHPQGVAVDARPDAAGRRHVFVADDRNHRVVEYLPDGTYVRQVGSFGTEAGRFRFPYDVGIDAREPRQLYVADNNNHRVQAFDVASLTFQRTWGTFGYRFGEFAFLRALSALADDPAGGVAVANTANDRAETFDAAGARTAAWGIAGRGPGYVTGPQGVAIDADGGVHVADTVDDRVERLAPDGAYVGQTGYIWPVSGYAAPGSGNGQFDMPVGIAVERASGHAWVADAGNDRVQELGPDGAWRASYGQSGTAAGQFEAPRAVAIDARGVFVADTGNDRIQRRDRATGTWTIVDTPGATLASPRGIAIGDGGTLFVADTGNDRVLRVADGRATALRAPRGRGLAGPTGLAIAGDSLFVADTGNGRVLRFDLDRRDWDVVGTEGRAVGSFVAPTGLAVDAAGRTLVVADSGNDRIQRFTLRGPPPPATVPLTVAIAGSGAGTVASEPAGISCPTDCRQGFSDGSTVRLTATPGSGSLFTGWSGACTGTEPCTLPLRRATSVTATFVATAPAAPEPPSPSPPASGPPPSGRPQSPSSDAY